jgi:hypothetical protein
MRTSFYRFTVHHHHHHHHFDDSKCYSKLYNRYFSLNVQGTVTEGEVDGPEYEISKFCAPCNVGFFNNLRSDNLILNVLRLVRIFIVIEYKKRTSIRLHLCAYKDIYVEYTF